MQAAARRRFAGHLDAAKGGPMARVLGVGGVFFRSRDPGELAAWSQRCLGAPVSPSFGASFPPAAMPPGGLTVRAPFSGTIDCFNPAAKPFMINVVVDHLDEAPAQVGQAGA
jgi:hypothetical protein